MAVRLLSAEDDSDDVVVYREIRLEALKADPGAFASSYEREAAFDEETWRLRMSGIDGRLAAFFVDELDGASAGTAGVVFTEWDEAPMLVGMWVAPSARGRGVGKRLIDAAIDWARGQDAIDVVLWVVRDNDVAISLYERYGFVPSGKVDTLPSDPCAEELEMRFRL